MPDRGECGIVVIGCGVVGGAVADALLRNAAHLAARVGRPLALRAVVDVNLDNARRLGLPEPLLSTDYKAAIARTDVEVVVELIGGAGIARQVVADALQAGKCVVTANKALLAKHGAELHALAREHASCIAFEASCAGAIPIIAALSEELACDRVEALYGIVNGTCNYILTAMTGQEQTYAQALAAAQKKGLAEADPTLDVSGQDSAHKLAILAALAFGVRVELDQVYVEGIDKLQLQDIRYGHELGYVVKLLAIARRQEEGLSLRVHPAFISKQHPLAWVSGPFNAVSVYAERSGHTMYYGRGAGGVPTSAAVIGDIAQVALGNAQRKFQAMGLWPDRSPAGSLLEIGRVRGRYYLRAQVEDLPGVLAQIARSLGDRDISISSVLQHEPPDGGEPQTPARVGGPARGVPVVVTTHPALEANIRAALDELSARKVVKMPAVCIRLVDEHEEHNG